MRIVCASLVLIATARRPDSFRRGRSSRGAGTRESADQRAAVDRREVRVVGTAQRGRHLPESSGAGRSHPAVRALRLERLDAAAPPPCAHRPAHRLAHPLQLSLGAPGRPSRAGPGSPTRSCDAWRKAPMRRDGTRSRRWSCAPPTSCTWTRSSRTRRGRRWRARYDTNQLVDLVDGVGVFTLHAGAINSLGVEIEPDVPDRLPSGIPYTVGRQADQPPARRQGGAHSAARPEDWTPEQRKRFDPNGTGQRAANVFVTFVRNPPADRLRGPINQHILNATTLSVRQRETLLMRIGVLCRSEYEWAAHSRLGRRAGMMTDADVARIVAGPGQRRRRSARNGVAARDRRALSRRSRVRRHLGRARRRVSTRSNCSTC